MVQVYRARCIPLNARATGVEKTAHARRVLEHVLSQDSLLVAAGARYLSVAIEADGEYATGLFSADERKLPMEFKTPIESSEVYLEIDRHFRGVTTIVSPERTDVFVVVVPGLAGHPYGSFKERGGSFMWIIDYLPKVIPYARVLLYGYKSDIVNGRVHLRISELGRMLWRVLELRDNMIMGKPYIFIAHSLGGLVTKMALLLSCQQHSHLSRVTHGALFFGVPNLGMKQRHLVTIVKSDPGEELVANLAEGSEMLTILNADFEKHFNRADSEIFSFYESESSPILELRDGRPSDSGASELLVNRESATRCRHQDYEQKMNHELPRNHSDIVKFCRPDISGHLGVVIVQLKRIVEGALQMQFAQDSRTTRVSKPERLSQGFVTNQVMSFNRALFVERNSLCQQLEEVCVPRNSPVEKFMLRGGIVLVHGMRGGGKSMLVRWFTDKYKNLNCLDYIFYLDGSSESTLENDIGAIACLLGWETQHLRFSHLLARFISWQRTTKRWLLVIENANPALILVEGQLATNGTAYFCTKEGLDEGLVIIVRESAASSYDVASVCVNQMSFDEAIKLFRLRLKDSRIPERDLIKLAEEVGCHPLTMDGIMGYIRRNRFENASAQVLRFLENLRQPTNSTSATRALSKSFALFGEVFARLEALSTDQHHDDAVRSRNALSIMDLLAFSDRRGFQERILRLSWDAIRRTETTAWRRRRHLQALQVDGDGDAGYETVYEALTILHDHHLISWNELDRAIEIHPVVQMAAKRRHLVANVTDQPEPWEVALTTLSEAVSWDPLHVEAVRGGDPWSDRWIVHTHLISCVNEALGKKWFTAPGDALRERCEIGLKISIAMGESGKLEVASQLQGDICAALRELSSRSSPEASEVTVLYYEAMNELGISIMDLGRSEEALDIRQRICSDVALSTFEYDHYYVLAWKANLAQTYFDLGRKEEAYQLREDALSDYPRTIDSLPHEIPYIQCHMDIADSLESLGRTPEALYHRHIALMRYLGIPTQRWSISYLEQLLSKGGALNRIEVALLRGIAKSYHQFGRYLEALDLREKLLEWEQKSLHESHMALLDIYSDYAATKEKLGHDVLDIRLHVYEKSTHIFGENHSRTVAARVALAEAQAQSQVPSLGIDSAYQLLHDLLARHPSHHVSVLYVKDRISQLKVLSPDEKDHLEALKLQQEIYAERKAQGLDGTYDTLIAKTRIADCYARLYRHVDALNAHKEVLEQGLKSLVAYKPGSQERQTHPFVLTMKALLAKDYFQLGDPLCSCFQPGDTCNNILPSPIILSPTNRDAELPTACLDRQNSSPIPPYDVSDESDIDDYEHVPPPPFAILQRPLDGRHIEMSWEEINKTKAMHMKMAIDSAREVLKSRTEIFSERHKSTVESMKFLAELLDFDDLVANEDEVEQLETQIESCNAKLAGVELPVQSLATSAPQQRVKDWVQGLDDAGGGPPENSTSNLDDYELSLSDEHMKHGIGVLTDPLQMVNYKDDGNVSLFQDLSEGPHGTKRPLADG